jgi:hypothetical protein
MTIELYEESITTESSSPEEASPITGWDHGPSAKRSGTALATVVTLPLMLCPLTYTCEAPATFQAGIAVLSEPSASPPSASPSDSQDNWSDKELLEAFETSSAYQDWLNEDDIYTLEDGEPC